MLVVLAVLVAALAVIVQQSGSRTVIAGSSAANPSRPIAGAFPSGSPGNGSSSAVAVNPAGLSCPAHDVTAAGAPFCYARPSGFEDISASATFVETDPFRTMLDFQTGAGLAPRDLIVVVARKLSLDYNEFSDAELLQLIKAAQAGAAPQGVSSQTLPHQVSAPRGARGFGYSVTYTTGVRSALTLIYVGDTRVPVKCQTRDHPAAVSAGCKRVLASMQVVTL